ncbi:MAG: hypothetical protein ING19_14010, partial [Azospirillum sp.]|nr:hypothetical protein [Azospirillum sp.]
AKTESVMQELYDKGYATYPRTEIDFLHANDIRDGANSPEARIAAIAQTLPELAAYAQTPHLRRGKNGTYRDEECEHYAFVPTAKPLGGDVSPDAAMLYEVVAKRFLAHHLPDAVDFVTTVKAAVRDGETIRNFSAAGKIEKSPGWRRIYSRNSDDPGNDEKVSKRAKPGEDEDEESAIPPFVDGKQAAATGASLLQGKTQPPRRITFGGLAETCQRLIDWVEDPRLKAALHNDANPSQPKGLGTIASSKEFDKRLLEFDYIEEFRGADAGGARKRRGKSKDPAIAVTRRGMDIWRFFRKEMPDAVDPIARAQTEFELAAIGNAANRRAADEAYKAFLSACHAKQKEIVSMFVRTRPQAPPVSREAIAEGQPIDVPYGKNDAAKALGAKWDRDRETWVLPEGGNMAALEEIGCSKIADLEVWKTERAARRSEGRGAGPGTPIEGQPIDVPYGKNDAAKALGAKWDRAREVWVAPHGADMRRLTGIGCSKIDDLDAWKAERAARRGGSGSVQGTPIYVPYGGNDKVKALGGRWIPHLGARGSWIVPEGKSLKPFEEAGCKVWDPDSAPPKATASGGGFGSSNSRPDGKLAGTPINVPWDDAGKNRAKAKSLGARWSPTTGLKGSWYVPSGMDVATFVAAGFEVWNPDAAANRPKSRSA